MDTMIQQTSQITRGWFTYYNDCIYLRTKSSQYKINDQKVVQIITEYFPEIISKVITDREFYDGLKEQESSNIIKLGKALKNIIDKDQLEGNQRLHPIRLVVEDQELYGLLKYRYLNVEVEQIEDGNADCILLKPILENQKKDNVLIAGNSGSVVIYYNREQINYVDLDISIYKAISDFQDFQQNKVFSIGSSTDKPIQELLVLDNFTRINEKGTIDFNNVSKPKNDHDLFSKITDLIHTLGLYIDYLGFRKEELVTSKKCILRFTYKGQEYITECHESTYIKAYVNTFKAGLAKRIELEEIDETKKWVICENREELENYIGKSSNSQIDRVEEWFYNHLLANLGMKCFRV